MSFFYKTLLDTTRELPQIKNSDFIFTPTLPNVGPVAFSRGQNVVVQELGYFKSEETQEFDVYYPFLSSDAKKIVGETGLYDRDSYAAPIPFEKDRYTLIHPPTVERITFDTGEVMDATLRFAQSYVDGHTVYAVLYKNAPVQGDDTPLLHPELQTIKLVKNGYELKKIEKTGAVVTAHSRFLFEISVPENTNANTLVLNLPYGTNWRAFSTGLRPFNHFLVNGAVHGWSLNTNEKVWVVYWPLCIMAVQYTTALIILSTICLGSMVFIAKKN